jgi:hypothetical protein
MMVEGRVRKVFRRMPKYKEILIPVCNMDCSTVTNEQMNEKQTNAGIMGIIRANGMDVQTNKLNGKMSEWMNERVNE